MGIPVSDIYCVGIWAVLTHFVRPVRCSLQRIAIILAKCREKKMVEFLSYAPNKQGFQTDRPADDQIDKIICR